MQQLPYIPSTDAGLDAWAQNFSTLITATPLVYGLTSGNAVTIAAAVDSFHDAYLVTTVPATRTSPAVAAKDAAKNAMLAIVRPFAQQISKNTAVTDEDKIAVGVNLPNPSRTPVPPPTTAPALSLAAAAPGVLTIGYKIAEGSAGKNKPNGTIGVELWRAIGTLPAIDPAQASYFGTITKSPNAIAFSGGDQGKTVTFFARWVTRSGPGGAAQAGPWSAPLTAIVM